MTKNAKTGELLAYLNALWRRKWLILLPSLALAALAGMASFFLPMIYEVDAIIQPAKFPFQDEQGRLSDITPIEPRQIVAQINQGSYDFLLASQLGINIKSFPRLRAENLRDTKLIKVVVRVKDIAQGKAILQNLFNHLRVEMDRKVDVERKGIDTEITATELQKSVKAQELEMLTSKLKIIDQREKEILQEKKKVQERINSLEEAQRNLLKGDNKSDSLALGLVLYANEIQQSLSYINTLNELLSEKRLQHADISQKKNEIEKEIERLTAYAENLKDRKLRIDYSTLVKEPTESIEPVSPKKKLNILLGGFLGLIVFTLVALFLGYLERQRAG